MYSVSQQFILVPLLYGFNNSSVSSAVPYSCLLFSMCNAEETPELLKPCNKGTRMNCWENLYMQAFHQHNILTEEQQVSAINPLYELAYTSRDPLHIP